MADQKNAGLSEEDQRILAEAHGKLDDNDKKFVNEYHQNKDNKDHPANPDHPDHHKFKEGMGKVSSKMGNAAIFGFGASAGNAIFNNIF